MCFKGFDLGIKDKNGFSLCVGDTVQETYLSEDEEEEINYGKIVYATDKKAFGIHWKQENYIELFCDLELKLVTKYWEKVNEK